MFISCQPLAPHYAAPMQGPKLPTSHCRPPCTSHIYSGSHLSRGAAGTRHEPHHFTRLAFLESRPYPSAKVQRAPLQPPIKTGTSHFIAMFIAYLPSHLFTIVNNWYLSIDIDSFCLLL